MAQPLFTNRWPHANHGVRDILRWKMGCPPVEAPVIPGAPDAPAESTPVDPENFRQIPSCGWRAMWLGHASFLLQGCGKSILIDPVFSDYCSPIPIAALKRKIPTPCALSDLPPIDAILLTHNHYDHLDLSTLRDLGDVSEIVISEGNAAWLGKKLGRQVRELAWDQTLALSPGITVTATPAQHFSSRTPFDRDRSHWCGFLIEGGGLKLWHVGDSGYSADFIDIGNRHGPIDFAMIPIGAYQPSAIMRPMHMNPEEAVQAFIDARCHTAVAMHWGTFALTDEPMGEPPLRLQREIERRGLPPSSFTAPKAGEILPISKG
ncbi:MAG TPA: MBL fold metallo-hydrolase [Luteolibacter sp.]|nr:MBL fold metallo-hydrolase [Luteolibacter sp.]